MFETETESLDLNSLKQGDLVWLDHYQRMGIFEEYMEDLGYLFKHTEGKGFSVVNHTKVYPVSSLLKELF